MAASAWETVTIYALCDPSTLAVRYVGKAVDLDARLRVHKCESKSQRFQDHKSRWMRSINCNPKVEVLEIVPYEEWEDAERRWITEMRNRGCDLTNFTDGGQTSPMEGKRHTDESKSKMREASLKNGARPPSRKGAKASIELRAKLSESVRRFPRKSSLTGGWNKGIRKTHCRNGHEYSEENTRLVTRRGRTCQQCRTCANQQRMDFNRRKSAGV